MASDEAVKVANGIAQMYHPALPDDLVAVAATMIDDHTAALRAEVEALRARVPVWKSVGKESPPINKTVLLYDPLTPYVVTSATMWQSVAIAGVMTEIQVLVWCHRNGGLYRKALLTDKWQYITNPSE